MSDDVISVPAPFPTGFYSPTPAGDRRCHWPRDCLQARPRPQPPRSIALGRLCQNCVDTHKGFAVIARSPQSPTQIDSRRAHYVQEHHAQPCTHMLFEFPWLNCPLVHMEISVLSVVVCAWALPTALFLSLSAACLDGLRSNSAEREAVAAD